jgi:hypothetical protein
MTATTESTSVGQLTATNLSVDAENGSPMRTAASVPLPQTERRWRSCSISAATSTTDHIPNARLRIFPDAAHGFLFQYPTEFASLVNGFLDT